METAKLVLEYLRVFLSTPVMIATVAITFFAIFREDIKALLLRIASIRLPGGAELLTSQSQHQEREAEQAKKPAPDVSIVPEGIPDLPSEQRQQIENIIKSERANAFLWEYRYLNFFLVYRTQLVLDWLVSLPQPVSIHFIKSFWLSIIPSADERSAILNALKTHHLVQLNGEAIEVTPKGREYLSWRGPLPALPTSASNGPASAAGSAKH